ncbi:spermatogenesis-associated protein 20 [Rhodopirellula maiorica SM1]|uniref:Spermatogenesis-associated protein 20 n=1 Tax=Rhodopirellula maiorica SM1 TaxID=1265738 RepID=M5RPI7_9BACT|nr:thioredoxin domain-containing protein [Rhodopirellula maiorica]EMI21253.1 spermatogenesis-associated protein 20 [Rhodopirellula maiorica SM1]
MTKFFTALLPIVLATFAACECCGQEMPTQETPKQESASEQSVKHTYPANRLAGESSLYLLQHAHNPVDWYPWGEAAFEKAKRENKMVFLSVGYAACHWCHVMERESFVDREIAALLNERFVCIKVDREQRPDVDQIYMLAVQIVSRGNGGWPMSVFLTPKGKPFWAGTYFPARTGDRGQSTGFLSILRQIDQAWTTQRDAVQTQADALTLMIKANRSGVAEDEIETATAALNQNLIERVAESLKEQFDPVFGGFGYSESQPNRPKFPEPSNLYFLMDRIERKSTSSAEREHALTMLTRTLDGMISGAMFDHIGGGFHRYSVDRRWQIPHFEKMLYDNGQLASVYARAYKLTQRQEYRDVAIAICDFVLRELTNENATFYSSLDADSEGEEGKFYRWSKQEIEKLEKSLSGFDLFATVYQFHGKPNFEGEFFAPESKRSLTEIAKQRDQSYESLRDALQEVKDELREIRDQRERPLRDEKVLAAWNGLMIAGLADCGRLLDRPEYVDAAKQAADHLLRKLAADDGVLRRDYATGSKKLGGYLDDYAFLVSGLIALHRADGEAKWLRAAESLTEKQIELFWDDKARGFFFTTAEQSLLIVRMKNPTDGALPAGASVAAENLLYLQKHSDAFAEKDYLGKLAVTAAAVIKQNPAAAPRMAAVLADYVE